MGSRRYKSQRRLKPKRSRVKTILKSRFFWFSVLGFLCMGGAAYGIFFTPFFQIERIVVSGNAKIPAEALREIAQIHLSRKFVLFELNHFLLANTSAAAEAMKAAFPEIESVNVQKEFPDSMLVAVRERQGIALWCQGAPRQCFALDAQGVIFEEREPEKELILSKSDSGEVNMGEEAVDPELLKQILSFGQQLDTSTLFGEVGLRVSSAVVVSKDRVNANISDLSLAGQEDWEIYLNPAEDIDWQVTKVKLVLEKEIPSAKRPFLEYIDLRFGDQAYIKYR